jgi:Mn2+/Fe2+ NRAMP family transporter
MLCNDREILGPWVNRPWLNAIAGVIIGVLILLSFTLTLTTLLPGLTGDQVLAFLGGGAAIGLGGAAAWGVARLMRGTAGQPAAATAAITVTKAERAAWRMPSLALLRRPAWSPARWVTMVGLRCYVVCAVVLVIVKIVQLAAGH